MNVVLNVHVCALSQFSTSQLAYLVSNEESLALQFVGFSVMHHNHLGRLVQGCLREEYTCNIHVIINYRDNIIIIIIKKEKKNKWRPHKKFNRGHKQGVFFIFGASLQDHFYH